jgi:hypothetical protein
MMMTRRILFSALLLATLAACNGSGDGGSSPQVQGTWSGTLTYSSSGQQVSAVAAVIQDGPAVIYSEDGQMFVVSQLDDEQPIGGITAAFDQRPNEFDSNELGEFTGTADHDQLQMSAVKLGPICIDPGPCNRPPQPQWFTAQLDRDQPYSLSPDTFGAFGSGHWDGFVLHTNIATSLDFTAGGAWSGTDLHGCAWSGHIKQLGTEPQNLFKVTAQGGFDSIDSKCDATFTGVGYLSSTGTGPYQGMAGTYFFMDMVTWGPFNPNNFYNTLSGLMYEFKVH